MNLKDVKDIVDDFQSWNGNTFTLAALLVEAQKKFDAELAESMGSVEVADAIRAQ